MTDQKKDNICDHNNNNSDKEESVLNLKTDSKASCDENSNEQLNRGFDQQFQTRAALDSAQEVDPHERSLINEWNSFGLGVPGLGLAPAFANMLWSNEKRSQWNYSSKPAQPDQPNQPKRPILKNRGSSFTSDGSAQLLHTNAPNGDSLWYNAFTTDGHRSYGFRPNSNGKHIHWDASTFRDGSSSPETLHPMVSGFNSANNPISNGFQKESKESSSGRNWRLTDLEPKTSNTSNSIVDTLLGIVDKDSQYLRRQWDNNIATMCTNFLVNKDPMSSIWSNTSTDQNSRFNFDFESTSEEPSDKVKQLIASFRNSNHKGVASYTWSGQLPRRARTRNPIYSCKVFLGGIPYDLTDSDLHCTFAQFGHIQIQWPGKDVKSAIEGAAANKAGYVYIVFESYDNVAALLSSSTISYRDLEAGWRWYFEISSRRQKGKEVQVIPFDIGDRFYMKSSFSGQMEHSRTVFVGALHGMLTADGLAKIMDDLFGGVIFAGLDTDKHKYPLGSGRVSFDNEDSYLKAVSAAFVEIKSNRFKKKIQIDPYIENESICAVCRVQQQSPVFCRDDFQYFCHKCWDLHHSDPESAKHRPIIKNKPSNASS